MGFGIILANGDSNAPLGGDFTDALIEIRVEQSLGEPTTYAIRFRDDICDNQFVMSARPELQPDQVLSVIVQNDDSYYCLVRGPVTEAKASYSLGGPGSFFEVHGADRRMLLSYSADTARNTGSISDIADSLLSSAFSTREVQSGLPTLGDSGGQGGSNQRGTKLDHLRSLATDAGAYLWITYDASSTPMDGLTIEETAHFSTSPPRGFSSSGVISALGSLVPDTNLQLDGGAGSDCGPNISSLEVNEDFKRATQANASGVDARSGETATSQAQSPDQPLDSSGTTAASLPGPQRSMPVSGAGDAEANRRRAAAALSDEGWFVKARASTSLHMLGDVVEPHKIITLAGVGPLHSMPFQISKVTHVVNANAHMMDLELRSNQRVQRTPAGGLP